MAMFPVFINLKGKNCLVVGGGKVAARKIETLLEFEPRITVISPDINEGIQQLKYENKVVVVKKKYSADDMDNAFIAIAATDDPVVNDRVHSDAQSRGILVNVVDSREKCTFVFPSVVVRDELVVGISTSGSFPVLSKRIREKVEAVLPEFYSGLIQALKGWRERAEEEVKDEAVRRELLNKILDEVLFYEDAISNHQRAERIDKIFEEYKHGTNH